MEPSAVVMSPKVVTCKYLRHMLRVHNLDLQYPCAEKADIKNISFTLVSGKGNVLIESSSFVSNTNFHRDLIQDGVASW